MDVNELWDWTKPWVREQVKNIGSWFRSGSSHTDVAEAATDLSEIENLLVVGEGGVGKTTFSRLMDGSYNPLFDLVEFYEQSFNAEENLDDIAGQHLVTLPGQSHRRRDWDPYLENLAMGEYSGLVIVNSYGFHTIRTSYKGGEFFKQGMTPASFLPTYLTACRDRELAIVDKLHPFLMRGPEPMWILTLVLKQDL